MKKIIALLLTSLLFSSTLAMAANEKKPQVRVQLMIFSGRPNPVFAIDDPEVIARLKQQLRQLPKASAAAQGKSVSPDKLGYTGFMVEEMTADASDPVSFIVYGSRVELGSREAGAGSARGPSLGRTVHDDSGRALEQLLLDLGKAKGAIDAKMEKRIKGEK